MTGTRETIAVAGAGIGGLSAAIALHRMGYKVQVYEAAPHIKPLGAGLLLAANAMKAYRAIGMEAPVLQQGHLLEALCIKDAKGRRLAYTDAKRISQRYGHHNFAVHRADLHAALMQALPAEAVHSGKRANRLTLQQDRVHLHFDDGSEVQADALIAADGIHSALRKQLAPESELRYAGYTCWRGVADARGIDLDPKLATESWGRGKRFGIVPLTQGRVYWFACMNARERDPAMRDMDAAGLSKAFAEFHAPVPRLIAATPPEAWIWNDLADLRPLRQFAFGRVLLLGDAAHATTPNLGQGACQAIEDAAVLAATLNRNPVLPEAFRLFEQQRIARTTRVVEDSRRIGRIAQWQQPLMAAFRNTLLRSMPDFVNEKQLQFLLDVEFEPIV